jgi:hypothetical protein
MMIARRAEVVLQFHFVLSINFGCYDDVQMSGLSYFWSEIEEFNYYFFFFEGGVQL